MLAADTYMQVRVNRFAQFDSHLHQLANANLIQFRERIVLEDLRIIVCVQELACVVTGESVCHLGKVVCTEAEEVSFFSDLVSCQSSSRDLDHGTNLIFQVDACCCDLSVSSLNNELLNILQLFDIAYKRDHDLRMNIPVCMSFLHVDSRADNSFGLHLGNLRIGNCQTASTVTHHRVELMERIDDRLDLLNSLALCVSQFLDVLFLSGNELMKRRIQETDRNRVSFQSFIQLLEVALLFRKDLLQSCFSLFYCLRADHLTECVDSVAFEEHMLCTAQTDTFCAQLTCFLSVSRCICVCTNLHGSVFVSPCHDSSEFSGDGSVYSGDDSVVDVTCCTVDGDRISFVEFFACKGEFLVCFIHSDVAASGYTAGSHTTCNYCCVRGHTAANSQDTLSGFHTGDIFRRCLKTYKNDFLASCRPFYCVVSREYDLTACSSRGSAKAFAQRSCGLQCSCVELRMKKCIQVTRIDHCNSFFLCSHALVNKVAGDLQSSLCSSLTVTCLKHIQFTMLYSKLHILHISVMCFQSMAYFLELFECLRELLLHLGDVHRCTNAGNNVLALSVGQELTEQSVLACSRVTGKCNTGTAVVAHVTESHHLYVNSCTPGIRDIVVTTVYVCSRVVPGTEYGFDSAYQLLLGICREIGTDFFFVFSLELVCQLVKVVSSKLNVLLNASLLFHLVDQFFEIFLADFHNYVRIHLDESSVAVPSPAGIVGLLSQHINNFFIQTKVEDSIHHTRHGCSCTRTNGNKQRIFFVTEFLTGNSFHFGDRFHDLSHDLVIDLSSVLIILSAGFCCDCEALGNRKAQRSHFSKIGTFTTQKVSHCGVTFCKHVNPFCHFTSSSYKFVL